MDHHSCTAPLLLLKSFLTWLQVYCILDEFVIGGEIQETSKKVSSAWKAGCCKFGTVQCAVSNLGIVRKVIGCVTYPWPDVAVLLQVILGRIKELDALET